MRFFTLVVVVFFILVLAVCLTAHNYGIMRGRYIFPPVWETLTIPVIPIDPSGGLEPPEIDPVDGLIEFIYNKDQVVGGAAVIPHSWQEGTPVYPILYVYTNGTGTGTVEFNLQYKTAAVDESLPTDWASETVLFEVPPATFSYGIVRFSGFIPTGSESGGFIMQLIRMSKTGIYDTCEGDIKLVRFGLHLKKNKLGRMNPTY